MAFLILPERSIQRLFDQPLELNLSHSGLTRVIAAWITREANTPYDLYRQRVGSRSGSTNIQRWPVEGAGFAKRTAVGGEEATDYQEWARSNSPVDHSLLAISLGTGQVSTAGTANGVGWFQQGSGFNGLSLFEGNGTSNLVYGHSRRDTTSASTGGLAPTTGRMYCAITVDSPSTVYFAMNGVEDPSPGSPSGNYNATMSRIATADSARPVLMMIGWKRPLSLGERIEYSARPDQLFVKLPGTLYFLGSGGGGGSTQTISASAITSLEAFGTPTLDPVSVAVSPSGIASAEAFGTARLQHTVRPSAVSPLETFGTPVLDPVSVALLPTAIASAEAFGTPVLDPVSVNVQPTAIASAEAFGTATLTRLDANSILPGSIASSETFGTPTLDPVSVTLLPTGIEGAEAFGTARFQHTLRPGSIGSSEAFGTTTLSQGAIPVLPDGIASLEAFGSATIVGGAEPPPAPAASPSTGAGGVRGYRRPGDRREWERIRKEEREELRRLIRRAMGDVPHPPTVTGKAIADYLLGDSAVLNMPKLRDAQVVAAVLDHLELEIAALSEAIAQRAADLERRARDEAAIMAVLPYLH